MILASVPTLDLAIGRGDNAPSLVWSMPFAVAGSDFTLTVTSPNGSPAAPGLPPPPPTVTTLTVSGGGLTLDLVANTVSWQVTAAQSAALPASSTYTLRRNVSGGEIRYYADGRIFGIDGPVGPSGVTVQVAGPQGPLPSNAQIVAAVESVIGQPGGIAGQDALAAEIARAKAAEAANAAAITNQAPKTFSISIAAKGQTVIPMPVPPTLLSSVRLVVNFMTYAAPVIAATSTALTWQNPDFQLYPDDNVLLTFV